MISATIHGHLGRDPEWRQAGQTNVLELAVGCTTKRGREEVTTWVKVKIWGNRGQALAQHLAKGREVVVSGSLMLSTWTGNDGAQRSTLEMDCDQFDFAGPPPQQAQAPRPPGPQAPRQAAPAPQAPAPQAPAPQAPAPQAPAPQAPAPQAPAPQGMPAQGMPAQGMPAQGGQAGNPADHPDPDIPF